MLTLLRKRSWRAFTLIELLVVVGIIGLLIGILLPSMRAARKAAKNSKVKMQLKATGEGLQMFQNDTGDFPDSKKRKDPTDYAVNPDPGRWTTFDHPGDGTYMWGAHALARALVGKDFKGYVQPKKARRYRDSSAPTEWYDFVDFVTPANNFESTFPREDVLISEKQSFYRTNARPSSMDTQLGGVRPSVDTHLDPLNTQLVLVDVFERPILYYKANPHGKVLCGDEDSDGDQVPDYVSDITQLPYYNILDNDFITGYAITSPTVIVSPWRFSPRPGITFDHELGVLGDPADPHDGTTFWPEHHSTFSMFIHDHKSEQASGGGTVKPYNPDSYLLISAGSDGIYGTSDDITNFNRNEE